MKKQLTKTERSRLALIAWNLRKESRKLGSFPVPQFLHEAMRQQGFKYRKQP